MPYLTLKFKDKIIGEYSLEENRTFAIGRRTSNDAVIVNLSVSGYHAEIGYTDKGFLLKDLDSKNGTLLNGKAVKKAILKDKDLIVIGKHELLFEEKQSQIITGQEDSSSDSLSFENPNEIVDQTVIIDTQKHKRPVPQPVALNGVIEFTGKNQPAYPLNKQMVRIGKDKSCDIVVKGFFNFLVGNTSATISKRPDGYYISSGEGFAKPRVNQETLTRVVKLKSSDIISIGSFKMKFFLQ